jgi:hypothetical protein
VRKNRLIHKTTVGNRFYHCILFSPQNKPYPFYERNEQIISNVGEGVKVAKSIKDIAVKRYSLGL